MRNIKPNPHNYECLQVLLYTALRCYFVVSIQLLLQLVSRYVNNKSDCEIQSLVDKIDWYIAPVMNPDGYEFTHTTVRLGIVRKNNYG